MKRLVGLAATLGVVVGLFGGGSSALAARTLAPPTADFGNQQIGTTSAPKAFVLTATCPPHPILPGQCLAPEVVPTEATTVGDFTVVQNACPQPVLVATNLAPVACVVTVAFKPTAIGPFVGSFKIGGLSSALTGTGTPAPVVTPPTTPNTPALPPTTNPAQKKKKKCGKRKGQKAKGSAVASAKGKRCGKRK